MKLLTHKVSLEDGVFSSRLPVDKVGSIDEIKYKTTVQLVNDVLNKIQKPAQIADDIRFSIVAFITLIIFFGCLALFLAPFLQWPYYSLYLSNEKAFYTVLVVQTFGLVALIIVDLIILNISRKRMVEAKNTAEDQIEEILKKQNKEYFINQSSAWEFEWGPSTTGAREEANPVLLFIRNNLD
ncbi:2 TM domain-containing transmembrane protein [Acrasis kona]|uniref:2 TM domain-containing transmembrane protein n=1 Tax=Acrasis kona TaxID=1008807 RepID=A0AAW2ZPY2_9EUKA